MAARRRYPESELQQASAQLMRTCLRRGAFAFHVPNERESGLQRQILAGAGIMPGVADWIVLAPLTLGVRGDSTTTVRAAGLAYAIELKYGRNGQTEAQRAFEQRCEDAHVPYRVCRSIDEVAAALRDWMLLRPGVTL